MSTTIQEVSAETLKIQGFLEDQKNGATITYLEIQETTGVRMDASGRAKLRRALKRGRREYSCIFGAGIRLADPESCMPILSRRIIKIDRAVRRADKSQKLLQEQFFTSLSADEQRKILFAGAVFGAIRLAAEQGRQLYSNRKALATTINVPLPQM